MKPEIEPIYPIACFQKQLYRFVTEVLRVHIIAYPVTFFCDASSGEPCLNYSMLHCQQVQKFLVGMKFSQNYNA